MKLSEIKGERTLEVIANLIEPIASIAQDEAIQEARKKLVADGDVTPSKFVTALLPTLISQHKQDIIIILATIEGVKPEEYEETLNLAKLMKDAYDLMTDEAFSGFFDNASDAEE